MARQRHYRNAEERGVPVFMTTTVLDFVHAFARTEARDVMAYHLARECKLEKAALYAYVVMPHHIHMVVRLRPDQSVRDFMRIFKVNTGRAVSCILTAAELAQFDQQRGLNRNTFWQRSFRSIVIESEQMFWQKVDYVHMNPVRAGYVEHPEDFVWSSARLVLAGKLSRETGLPYDDVVNKVFLTREQHQSFTAYFMPRVARMPPRFQLSQPPRPEAVTPCS